MVDGAELDRVLGPLEAAVVQVIIDGEGPMVVRSVLEDLNRDREPPLAYTTVMTVMTRLAEKGVLERRPQGRGYVYQAMSDSAAGIAVRLVLRDFGDAAIAQFAEEARADPELRARLRRLLRKR